MGVTYIARISKPGFSVYDPDPKNFSLREDTNSPKAFIRSSVDILPGYNDKTVIVNHNLGYKPFSMSFIYNHGTGRVTPGDFGIATDSTVKFVFYSNENILLTAYYDVFYEGGP